MYLKTEGLVLRQVTYQDSDQILTILTRDHGLLSAKARGVLRGKSALKSGCQLLAYTEFTLFEQKGYYIIKEANTIEMFHALRSDIELLALASYFAQLAEVLSQEDLPNPELLALTLNALYALCKKHSPQDLVKAAVELRAACLSGYAPQLDGCAICGAEHPDRFNVTSGALQCSRCGDAEGLRLPVGAGTLAAMRYIVSCDKKKLFSFRLDGVCRKELCDLTETYLITQLERGFYTLDFYKSLWITEPI